MKLGMSFLPATTGRAPFQLSLSSVRNRDRVQQWETLAGNDNNNNNNNNNNSNERISRASFHVKHAHLR